jgi:hypothetical protein
MVAEIHPQTNSELLRPGALDQGRRTPLHLYHRARDRGRQGQWWSRLTGRPRYLLELAGVEANYRVRARSDAELRTVAIDQIRGSQGRSRYFDRDFQPLHDQTWRRWLSIAQAKQQGKALPPVVLVQVCDIYFVRDGHHRISVARALGQSDIEARVIVWHVTGPLRGGSRLQPPRRGFADRVLGIGHALKERWLQYLSSSAPADVAR